MLFFLLKHSTFSLISQAFPPLERLKFDFFSLPFFRGGFPKDFAVLRGNSSFKPPPPDSFDAQEPFFSDGWGIFSPLEFYPYVLVYLFLFRRAIVLIRPFIDISGEAL